mgnify:CR=1 FL=1
MFNSNNNKFIEQKKDELKKVHVRLPKQPTSFSKRISQKNNTKPIDCFELNKKTGNIAFELIKSLAA